MMPGMRKCVFIAVLAVSCSVAFAQSGNMVLFERAVDRLNCEAVGWSMENVTNSRFKEQCPCESALTYDQIKTCIGGADAAKTQALAEDIERIKKDFRDEWSKDQAVQFLTRTVFNDNTKHRPLYEFASKPVKEAEKDKPRRDQGRFNDITRMVATELDEWAIIPPVQVQAQVSASPGNYADVDDGYDVRSLFLVWLASVLTSALIIFLLLRRMAGGANGGEVSNEVRSYVKTKIQESQQGTWAVPSSKQGQRNSGKNNDLLGERIRNLEQQVVSLREQIAAGRSNSPASSPVPDHRPEPTAPALEALFLPGPDENGSFNEGDASQAYREGATVYKLYKQGPDRATFAIHDHPQAIRMAIEFHREYIKPVCDASNAYDHNTKRIVTETPGEARLEGGKWRTIRKARIRYEH